jgi:biotin synthase
VHREHFDPTRVQRSTLLSIKTGGCPEDCGYCPQGAARYHTGVENQELLPLDEVIAAAKAAQANGRHALLHGRGMARPQGARPRAGAGDGARGEGARLEACCTLGMLKDGQAEQLQDAGLDYYNHNLDTAPEFYGDVISTRDYEDRLDTLERVRGAGVKVCCGGIVGMGESRSDAPGSSRSSRASTRNPSRCRSTSWSRSKARRSRARDKLPWIEFVRTIAAARIMLPRSVVRLSAGRRR